MADIEYTHPAHTLLHISGRVGQTVAITFSYPPSGGPYANVIVFNKPLPAGLIYSSGVITGTLLTEEAHSYFIPGDGPFYTHTSPSSATFELPGQITVLPALVAPDSIPLDQLTAILNALNPPGSGGGTTTSDPNLPVPDPNGGLNGTNAEGDISVPIDFDLTTRQVFIPNGYSLPAAGEESKIDLPDWAPGTFSIGAIMSVKENDRFPVAIGCLRPGELIEVGGLTNIEIFARERAGERRFDISEVGFVQMAGVMRYKVILNLQSAGLKAILKSYESVNGAYVDLMTEIRLTITIPGSGSGEDSVLVRTSHTFALRFEQKMGS